MAGIKFPHLIFTGRYINNNKVSIPYFSVYAYKLHIHLSCSSNLFSRDKASCANDKQYKTRGGVGGIFSQCIRLVCHFLDDIASIS